MGKGGADMRKRTRLALAVLLAVLMSICGQLERYTLEVTATEHTITGRDLSGKAVVLTECRADDGSRILLKDVTEGNRYRVTLDSCGTWNREDDAIIRVIERSESK